MAVTRITTNENFGNTPDINFLNELAENNSINGGIISLDLETLSVNEEVEEAVIPIVRIEGSDGTVSVDYSINEGTAIAGDDFTASSGTLTFAPGETSKEIVIPIIDDLISETDETFSIAIGNEVGAELGEIRTAIVTIEDNDGIKQDTIVFSQAEYNIGEKQVEASITLIRTGNGNGTVSIDYASNDDYARAGSDYIAVSGTLTFEPGETSKTFTVPLLNDNLPELDEALSLTLSNPVGIELGPQNIAKLIIEDNDDSPFIFDKEVLVVGENVRVSGPVAFDWTPDGKMLIAERDGVVRVFDNGKLLEQPFIDISEQVNTGGGKGLLGLAVHPEFLENPYVYLAFSYDPPDVELDQSAARATRLIRVAADSNSNYTMALSESEVILLETPPVNNFHTAGAIRFDNDGSLFFSHGDGLRVDGPPTPEDAELLQSLDNHLGKLFRIDPITGEGYSDNPFYDGDPTSIQSKVYNYGLRNPWRFTLHPDTSEPFIGDVGWTNWEEINTGRGVNFGWTLYEGGNGVSLRTEAFANAPEFQALYDSVSAVTAPIYARSHEDGGRAITVGDFYTGTTYPQLYQGALFFNEFSDGEVNALLFDEEGNVDSVIPFLKEEGRGITQISVGPDSNLYFSNLFTGEIGRWVFRNSFYPGKPNFTIGAETSVFLWKDTFDGPYRLRTIGADTPSQFTVNLIATDELLAANPIQLESNDQLEITDFGFSLKSQPGGGQDGVDFSLAPGTKALISVTQDGVANPQQFNIGSQRSHLKSRGWILSSEDFSPRPSFNPGEDLGLFVGKGERADILEFRYSGDGIRHETELTVLTQKKTATFVPVAVDRNDKITQFNNGIKIVGRVNPHFDGIDVSINEPVQIGFTYKQDEQFQNPFDDLLGLPNAYELPLANPYGQPNFDASQDAGIFLWKDKEAGVWELRATAGGDSAKYVGSILSDLPVEVMEETQTIEANDKVDVSDPLRIDFNFNVMGSGQDGIRFRFPNEADLSLELDDGATPLQIGSERWSVSQVPLDLSAWL